VISWERVLAEQLRQAGLPEPALEYRWAPPRRWRLDLAWPELRLYVEIDGGAWSYGRHNRAGGFLADLEKRNALALAGWRGLHVTPQQVARGEALELCRRLLGGADDER
jgi:very-short-patch-repair endonuclease